MAGKPIELKFVADVAAYLRDVKKVEVSTEDIADALVGVSSDAQDLQRKLERAMKDSARDTERLERAIRDLPDATRDAARKMDGDFERMGDDAGEAGREMGSELRQNMGESLASGGSLEDIFTDTIGGLISSMPGQFAAVAVPVGVAVLGVFNTVAGNIRKFNENVSAQVESIWDQAMSSIEGKVGQVAVNLDRTLLIQEELNRLWSESPDDMERLVEASEQLGISSNDVLLARAGDEAALQRVKEAIRDSEEATDNYVGATSEAIKAHDDIVAAIGVSQTATDELTSRTNAYNRSLAAPAAAIALMKTETADVAANIALWKKNADIARAAFEAIPTDIDIRMRVFMTGEQGNALIDQYFPYGVVTQNYSSKHN